MVTNCASRLDIAMDPVATEMASSLALLSAKETASIVWTKLETLKTQKDVEKMRVAYDQIINDLLQERGEALRIAQAYKEEVERMVISDEDIESLHATIDRLLDVLVQLNGKDAKSELVSSVNGLKSLVNADTLKTMQLLGFNYKETIGLPLTRLCAEKITSLGGQAGGQKAHSTVSASRRR